MQSKKKETAEQPFSEIATLIGSKWKLTILVALRAHSWRFNDLQKHLNIHQKVLTQNLRAMEKNGIITRTIYPEMPPRVEYSLSSLGESVIPILNAIEQWNLSYKK